MQALRGVCVGLGARWGGCVRADRAYEGRAKRHGGWLRVWVGCGCGWGVGGVWALRWRRVGGVPGVASGLDLIWGEPREG